MPKRKNEWAKIVVYVPISHGDKIRHVLNLFSGSKLGKYDYCSFTAKGIGRFRPLTGAKPFIGSYEQIEQVEEERIETMVLKKDTTKLIKAIRASHPYEEPVIDIYPLLYP
jgi:hypothetical protein